MKILYKKKTQYVIKVKIKHEKTQHIGSIAHPKPKAHEDIGFVGYLKPIGHEDMVL